MAISVICAGCGKRLKAKESLAGRTVACPNCKHQLTIPQPEDEAADFLLEPQTMPAPARPAAAADVPRAKESPARAPRPAPQPRSGVSAALPPLDADEPPLWRPQLLWLLIVAVLPTPV